MLCVIDHKTVAPLLYFQFERMRCAIQLSVLSHTKASRLECKIKLKGDFKN